MLFRSPPARHPAVERSKNAPVFPRCEHVFVSYVELHCHSAFSFLDGVSLPDELEPTGWTSDGVLMAMRHRTLPLEGAQFHPESVLTEDGHRMLASWMAACGHPVAETLVEDLVGDVRALALGALPRA